MIRNAPFALILLFAAGPALAAEPPVEVPTATAPSDVGDQIAAYLRDSPVAQLPADGAPDAASERPLDRRPHGMVEVGVGSHGYRSVYMETEVPLGEDGRLSVAIGQSQGGLPRYYRRGPGLDGRYDLGGRYGAEIPRGMDTMTPEPPR